MTGDGQRDLFPHKVLGMVKLGRGGPKARRTDPPTSHAAARKANQRYQQRQDDLRDVLLQFGPKTDEQLEDHFPDCQPSTLRGTRSVLVKLGLVVDSGATRTNKHGNGCVVWAATAKAVT